MKTMQRKTKDWADLKFPDDPATKEKVERSDYPANKKIPIMHLKAPEFVDRFSHRVSDDEMDHLQNIPLEVIKSAESGKYVIVKGLRYYVEGINQGVDSVQCVVLSKVKSDFEAYIRRLEYVFTDHQPFHILEQAMCVQEIKKLVINKYGHNNVFQIGGDRRSKHYKKKSMIKIIQERLPYRKSTIATLNRLGKNIGPVATKGLYKILSADNENLSLNKISKLNPKMRRENLRGEIDGMISRLIKKKMPQEEIEEAVAYRVYDFIFKNTTKTELKTKNGREDEPEDPIQSDPDEAISSSTDRVVNTPDTTDIYPIGPKEIKKIKKYYIKRTMNEQDAFEFLMSKDEFSKNDTREFQKKLDMCDLTNTDFMCIFLKAANGKEINE